MNEKWKDIKGYEGLYQVSDLGRIRSCARTVKKQWFLKHIRERILKQGVDRKSGYCNVSLRKDGKYNTIRVHRIVAEAFVENPHHYNIVNHKDCNPGNNNASNLEWCTQRYNICYGDAVEKRAAQIRKPVRVFKADGAILGEFDCADSAALAMGLKCRDTVYRNISGSQMNRQGYKVEYIKQ